MLRPGRRASVPLPEAAGPSTAMTTARSRRASTGAIAAPRPFISATKPGKLVAIAWRPSTVTGARASPPSTRKLMAMRWSSWASIGAAAGGSAAAVHDQAVALDLDLDAAGGEPGGHRPSRSLSLTRSSPGRA